ncbi:O-fucosyltransferase 1-like, partial [Oryza sativa Japonica Group]|uniref:O-fucosyltransferase 1-like n=1 Tax=Oryza sativa subsp. japonica TaxID=39947 RepID=UPI00339C2860
ISAKSYLLLTSVLLFKDVDVNKLWRTAYSNGWRASSAPRTYWPPPPSESESNGYLRVRCNGGLSKQHSAICDAVVVARIMNATLVLPELATSSFWHDERNAHATVCMQGITASLHA